MAPQPQKKMITRCRKGVWRPQVLELAPAYAIGNNNAISWSHVVGRAEDEGNVVAYQMAETAGTRKH